MAEITVDCSKENRGWTCDVRVTDSETSSHTVDVPASDYEELAGDADCSVDELIEESFEFLLEREPQSAIMSQFEIRTIERYFPGYPDEIPQRLRNRETGT
jgi:hypothetical protein